MSDRAKKVFIILSVAVPFLLYSVYYYGGIIKNAPYRFADFDSITFNYGKGDSLVNRFNSKTTDYQYLTLRDSLVKTHLKLDKDDLIYLHHKASDLGFWDFPSHIEGDDSARSKKAPHYYIEFKYKTKTKQVWYDDSYNDKADLKDAARRLITELQNRLADAEQREKK
jgi:hypothetical protein